MRNLGQMKCKRCLRWHQLCLQQGCIPDPQWAELQHYARQHGRTWKAQLREAWLQGSEELRWARNLFGPRGLDNVRLDARRYARKSVRRRR